jgi:hypothetical protein
MAQFSVHDAKTNLSCLTAEAPAGDVVISHRLCSQPAVMK